MGEERPKKNSKTLTILMEPSRFLADVDIRGPYNLEITLNRADLDDGLDSISDTSGTIPLGVRISASLISFVGERRPGPS
jgi:hypothetical protein